MTSTLVQFRASDPRRAAAPRAHAAPAPAIAAASASGPAAPGAAFLAATRGRRA